MFAQRLFTLVSCLIYSRWVRGYQEHHRACEDTCTAYIGLLYLEINHCFVLDHNDATICIHLPLFWGELHLGYAICLGEEQIRQSGFYARCWNRLPKALCNKANCPSRLNADQIPF